MNTISEVDYLRMEGNEAKLMCRSERSDRVLRGYANENPLAVICTFQADLYINEALPSGVEKFYVVKGSTTSLLSRRTAIRYQVLRLGVNACQIDGKFNEQTIDTNEMFSVHSSNTKPTPYPKFNISPVEINIDESVRPRRSTYTNIPISWRDLAMSRIKYMEESDIIEKVTGNMNRSHCSALLAVPKGINDFRLVVDMRNPNRCVLREPHAMPTIDSIFARIHGSKHFSTIDLSNAFFHVELAENSRHLTNFFTGECVYRYKRLPFGLCNAPDIFQKVLEEILSGIEGIWIYMDDILITSSNQKAHDASLKEVISRLNSHGVKLNAQKCCFNKREVKFLGFMLSEKGHSPTHDRIETIMNFRKPETVSEVRSFLGMIIFVDRFIINRAEKTKHMRNIVQENNFVWNSELQEEFDELRRLFIHQIETLGFYNNKHKTELIVDASPVGLGAVLVQFDEDNQARIIQCASKSLSKAEQRYPQVQREALAIVWAVERFQSLLRGIKFTIRTDNEGNEFIFGEEHKYGKRGVTRAEAWALRLQPYQFEIKRVSGKDNIADIFSRLVRETQGEQDSISDVEQSESHILTIDIESEEIVTTQQVLIATESDEELQAIIRAIRSGKWDGIAPQMKKISKNLSTEAGLVLFQDRLVIPQKLKRQTLKTAHQGHPGVGSTKRMLRRDVWWSGMSKDVTDWVANCEVCQQIVHTVRPVHLTSRILPNEVFDRIQVDFLDIPTAAKTKLMMVVETYSRMTWAIEMAKTDTSNTIKALEGIFKIWGRPAVIQTDNGPPYQSQKFSDHWESVGVRHLKVVPLSPWMNGMVERANKHIIKAVQAATLTKENWRDAVQNHLHKYNNLIPHSTTGATPFELMTGRVFRSGLHRNPKRSFHSENTHEEVAERDRCAKEKSIKHANMKRNAKDSDIREGDWVWVSEKQRANKSSSLFLKHKFRVLNRKGPKTTLRGEDGSSKVRWVSDLKKTSAPKQHQAKVIECDDNWITTIDRRGVKTSQEVSDLDRIEKFKWNDFTATIGENVDVDFTDRSTSKDGNTLMEEGRMSNRSPSVNSKEEIPQATGRQKRRISRPAKLKDYELYNIFG